MHPEVDTYLNRLEKWQCELTELRTIILACGLTEEYKWMHPCYTHGEKNIILLQDFKNYCAMLFQKGALLKDMDNILVQMTENVQSARQIRFTDLTEIKELESSIKRYIFEAIEVEKAGLKVRKKKTSQFNMPEELIQLFADNSNFENAFKNLTEGRQRGYLLHFSKPKQSKTRLSRIKQNMHRILNGYGLNDCVCGLSKRKPNCDGSHRQLEKIK